MNWYGFFAFFVCLLDIGLMVAMEEVKPKEKRALSFSLFSEPEEAEQGKATFIGSQDIIPYKMKSIFADPKLEKYAVQSYVASQSDVINSMNTAVEDRSASIDLSVGTHGSNKMDKYNVSSVVCEKEQHGKNIVGLSCSPSKGDPTKAIFFTGSANTSNSIWPRGNAEAMVYVEGDTQLSTSAYTLMKSRSPMKKKKDVVQTTPKKRTVYSSYKTELNQSRAERVLTVANQTGDDRIVWASSMNFNDQAMADALIAAAKSGANVRLIVNKSALTKNGLPLLQAMVDAGVQVFVYYANEGSRRIQHKKELIRKDLYIISNANFTDEGDFQKNLETYFPQDLELVDQAKIDFERIQSMCISLTDALDRQKTEKSRGKKRKAKKQVASIETKKRKGAQ